ncbi:MAG: helix-turn-helix transcriptional regulator [Oscillospiraceae bacterium]|nr:helix-turn-helix transcriptional regulator [Oscillospiraceae bacterium]
METYKRLKDLREDANLKQENIAQILGMKQQQYSEYERGKRELPLRVCIKIAKYYDVSIDYIVGLTNDKRKYW